MPAPSPLPDLKATILSAHSLAPLAFLVAKMSCDSLENLDWLSECEALTEVLLLDNPTLRCVRGVGRCRALESLVVQHSLRLDDLSALSACTRLESVECVSIGVKVGSKLPCSPRLKEVG